MYTNQNGNAADDERTKTMSSQTAKQAYEARMKQINERLTTIRQELKRHQQEFNQTPNHWGFPGDLGHIESLLHQIEAFLKNEDMDS